MLVNGASGRVRRPEPVVRQEALSTASCTALSSVLVRGPGTMTGFQEARRARRPSGPVVRFQIIVIMATPPGFSERECT
jgi:hypothetical protein